ncbi:hypothetical protein [Streptomyces sp. NBC_00370]|uniref:hypothetical protein n=1 Tax=Streptomyces sp. NBC_00370 TaxID=2975728 RepID=UPI002E27288A
MSPVKTALLQEDDGGDIGQCLGEGRIPLAQAIPAGVEEIHRSHGTVTQPKREDVGGLKAARQARAA